MGEGCVNNRISSLRDSVIPSPVLYFTLLKRLLSESFAPLARGFFSAKVRRNPYQNFRRDISAVILVGDNQCLRLFLGAKQLREDRLIMLKV